MIVHLERIQGLLIDGGVVVHDVRMFGRDRWCASCRGCARGVEVSWVRCHGVARGRDMVLGLSGVMMVVMVMVMLWWGLPVAMWYRELYGIRVPHVVVKGHGRNELGFLVARHERVLAGCIGRSGGAE